MSDHDNRISRMGWNAAIDRACEEIEMREGPVEVHRWISALRVGVPDAPTASVCTPATGEPRYNGGIRCDVTSGPCACGAWHRPNEALPEGFVRCLYCNNPVCTGQWAEPHTDEHCFECVKEQIERGELRRTCSETALRTVECVDCGKPEDVEAVFCRACMGDGLIARERNVRRKTIEFAVQALETEKTLWVNEERRDALDYAIEVVRRVTPTWSVAEEQCTNCGMSPEEANPRKDCEIGTGHGHHFVRTR